jgi:broad specificity phosphatase PhoE
MRLILVRHGETDWNRQLRMQGQSDIELNELGRRQVEALALALKEENIEAIYASPLRRALETAEAINRFHGVPIEVEEGLIEIDMGDIDEMTPEEVRVNYSSFWKQWVKADLNSLRFPQGESFVELQERTWAAIEGINRRHSSGTVAVVSHYIAIVNIICRALGLSLPQFRRLSPLGAAAISILDFEKKGITLSLFNDTCHLKGI